MFSQVEMIPQSLSSYRNLQAAFCGKGGFFSAFRSLLYEHVPIRGLDE